MTDQPITKKKWILNSITMSTPGHLASGLWKHPKNRTPEYNDIKYWTDYAKLLEKGKFHGIFIADVLSHYGVYKGPDNVDPSLAGAAQFPISDSFLPIAAMAAVTEHLSFGVTASTTYENPFLLARRLATLDHLTKGRVAWNVVTSHLKTSANNLGLDTEVPHDERYKIAEEFIDLSYKLWESTWRDDSVVKDLSTGEYAVPGRVRAINHAGKYFKSTGPLTTEPSIQRTPFIFQAGASNAGKVFAATHGECIFLPGMEPAAVRKSVDSIRELAKSLNRDVSKIKFIAGLLVIVDETDEKARARYEEYLSYVDVDGSLALFGGWTGVDLSKWSDDEDFAFSGPGAIQSMVSAWSATVPGSGGVKWTKKRIAQELAIGGPHPKAIGSAKTVADFLENFLVEADLDGFNFNYGTNPGDLEAVIEWLLPELRARGLFWEDYEGATTRENFIGDGLGPRLRDDHPGAKYRWRAE